MEVAIPNPSGDRRFHQDTRGWLDVERDAVAGPRIQRITADAAGERLADDVVIITNVGRGPLQPRVNRDGRCGSQAERIGHPDKSAVSLESLTDFPRHEGDRSVCRSIVSARKTAGIALARVPGDHTRRWRRAGPALAKA